MDSTMWDARYASSELIWSADPNQFVREHFQGKAPGRIVDLGCGEGRNAIWLAEQGWTVTAVDFSAVALEKTEALAKRRGVSLEIQNADLTSWRCDPPAYHAALLCYIHFPLATLATIWRAAFESLLPGGEVLIIGHHSRNLAEGVGGPQAAEVLFSPADVMEVLGAENIIEARDVTRKVESESGSALAIDALVVARRPG